MISFDFIVAINK